MKYIEAVTFLIIRPDGKILMQKRDNGRDKKILYPNMWTFPGGFKEDEESHIQAIIREIKEEYNLNITPEQCELILSYNHDNNINDQVFFCIVPQDSKPELNEGTAMQWMKIEEIKSLQLAWQLEKVFSQIEEKIKSSITRI